MGFNIYTEKILHYFLLGNNFLLLSLLETMIKPLRSFYIVKLELTSYRQASIWVVRAEVRWRRAQRSRDDTERWESRRGRRRTSAGLLNRSVGRLDTSIDFDLLWNETEKLILRNSWRKLNWENFAISNLLTKRRRMTPKARFCTHNRSFADQQVRFVAAECEKRADRVTTLTKRSARAINLAVKRNQRLRTLNRWENVES